MQIMECTIKKADDYLDALQEQFPEMSKEDIKRILGLGFNFIRKIIALWGVVKIGNKKLRAEIRKTVPSEAALQKNKRDAEIKARIKWNRGIKEYDGYYYFTLSEKRYKALNKKALRKHEDINFGNIMLYKSAEECWMERMYNTRFFRVQWPIDCGFTMYKENFTTNQYEYLGNEREKSRNKWIQQRPESRSEPHLTTKQYLKLLS